MFIKQYVACVVSFSSVEFLKQKILEQKMQKSLNLFKMFQLEDNCENESLFSLKLNFTSFESVLTGAKLISLEKCLLQWNKMAQNYCDNGRHQVVFYQSRVLSVNSKSINQQ